MGRRVAPSRPRPPARSASTHFSVVEIHVFAFIVSLLGRKGKASVQTGVTRGSNPTLPNAVSAGGSRGHGRMTPDGSRSRPREGCREPPPCSTGGNVRSTRLEAPESGPTRQASVSLPRAGSFLVTAQRSVTPHSHFAHGQTEAQRSQVALTSRGGGHRPSSL